MPNPVTRFRVESSIFLVGACLFVTLAHVNQWTLALDRLIYDTTIATTPAPMYDKIVIVSIDDQSLHEQGPWPWPRSLQADLIDKIASFSPTLIAADIVYAGSQNSDNQQLVDVVAKIPLFATPMIIDVTMQGGQHVEVMPFSDLADQTDIIGHVQVEFDDDAIVRGTYLYQGVGSPVWPHLTLGIAAALGYPTPPPCTTPSTSPLFITKCHFVQIPFAGPPSTYPQISAHQILNTAVLDQGALRNALENKVVLIGAVALGVGDWVTSPLGDTVTPLSGVEFNANLLSAVVHGNFVRTVPGWVIIVIACLLVALTCLALPRLRPKQGIITITITALAPILLTLFFLSLFSLHLPLASVTVASAIIYPLWSWRRHEVAWQFIESELDRIDSEGQRLHNFNILPANTRPEADRDGLQTLLNAKLSDNADMTATVVQRESPLNPAEQALLDQTLKPALVSVDALPAERLAAQIGRLQSRAKVVREGREIGLSALDHMSSGAVIISGLGQLTFANDEAERLLAIDTNQAHKLLELLGQIQPPLGQTWLEIWRTVVLRKETIVFESQALNSVPVFITARPLTEQNEPYAPFWVLTISDLTEIRSAQAQREEALAFLSHDLRSPLSSVLAIIEQSRDSHNTDTLEKIRDYTQRGLSASDQFLQLSRLQLHADIEFYSIDLEQVCQNALDQTFFLAKEKDIQVLLEAPEEPIWISANGELLERALINLLTNAIKYSPNNTRINVVVEVMTENVRVVVKDQGFGIPREELPHIFEPYFRSRAQELAQNHGAGLGLRFVKTVVDRHNGRIEVVSERGLGTTCTLTLTGLEAYDSTTATT
ncbi:MAG: CHASE2 domain-containing protein [Pseudomonadales bacterium]|nr:CHASE2 domain-containing protein [Pseudomonadales bacterium]